MTVHVAVVDPVPLFRHGVVAALSSAGHLVEEPADALAWVRERPGGTVLLTLDSAEELDRLTAMCRVRPRPLIVALLTGANSSLGAQAVRAGARSVVARTATVTTLRRAVDATLDGEAVMPAGVADLLVTGRGGQPPRRPAPSAQQVAWLRQLAEGWTVARLAAEAGYSERAMYRMLKQLYRQLGAATRLEAMILAHEEGWFQT
ncbi:response regulator transcription factor [Actinomadura fibrosa]|uniref:Response regulator transcription factor n=1 Tax=Actinomadura fibrosa TaxID=111802 RepID=A0ABW2XKA7_9ACTN|nr:response regulator transcription factor [Actinomadura fibrosa]